jgi:hypothetical protein
MHNNADDGSGDESNGYWARLGAFLETDAGDAGCDATMEMLDVYAELIGAGNDPAARFPGIHAHLLACDLCAEALEGLLEALASDPSGRPREL